MTHPIRISIVMAATALLPSCTVGANYAGPPQVAPLAAGRPTFISASPRQPAAPSSAQWWEELHDPTLSSLIERALHNSPTVQAAVARVDMARTQAQVQDGASAPSLGFESAAAASANSLGPSYRNLVNRPFRTAGLGLVASWEIDLFGANARKTEAARARAEGASAGLADAQVALTAAVAMEYARLRAEQERLEILEERSRQIEQISGYAQQRVDQGRAAQSSLTAPREEVLRAHAAVVRSRAEVDAMLNTLSALVGEEPGTLEDLRKAAKLPLPPANISIPQPAAVIRGRPDIRVAEANLAASTAEVGESIAMRFPKLSLLGVLGIGTSSGSPLLSPTGLNALAVPRLSAPLFDGGQRKGMVKVAEARRDEAEAQYREAVLQALKDCENALIGFSEKRGELADALAIKAEADASLAMERQRFESGHHGMEPVIRANTRVSDARIAVVASTLDATLAYIEVVKAVGLGWRPK